MSTVADHPVPSLGPPALRPQRLRAQTWLAEHDRPTRADEAWRYAPLRALEALTFAEPEPHRPVPPPSHLRVDLGTPPIVVVNGRVLAAPSPETLPAGAAARSLAMVDDDPTVERLLGERSTAHFYDAAVDAYAGDGLVIDIEPGAELDEPLHIVHHVEPSTEHRAIGYPVIIRAGSGCRATIVESRIGTGSTPGAAVIRTTLAAAPGADIEHVLVQDATAVQHHLHRLEIHQEHDSIVRSFVANLGAATSRFEVVARLSGPGAEVDLAGLAIGRDQQVHDHQIQVHHDEPNATSSQDYRMVLDDRSRGVFNGGIGVAPGADGTEAAQSNHNLLLSDGAEADTQPRLEILADDVSCSHGATVGQLDDDALYYLRTRGIPHHEARRILIDGFAHENLGRIAHPIVRAHVDRRIGELQR
jgi:Fe-S cluster assembly protein SufD